MPNVVSKYVENGDVHEVRREQEAIMDAYRRDISKHTTEREAIRIGQVLDSLPSQLAKENKKFIYGAVRKGDLGFAKPNVRFGGDFFQEENKRGRAMDV